MRSALSIVAALSLTLGCKRAPPPPSPPPAAAAVVDGQPIPVPLVQRELERLRRGPGREGPVTVDPRELPKQARAVLEPLIDRALLLAKARAAGLSVSDAEVQAAMDKLSESAQQGGQSFEERLAEDGQTVDGLASELREQLLAEKYMAASRAPIAPPAEKEVRAWYDAHRADYDQPERVRALQIFVSSAEQAKSLLDQARMGTPFEELARKYSESPDAKSGGDVGLFARGTMPKEFDEACFSLKVGQVSGVVPSPYGYHLFKVTEKRPARRRPFEEAKAEIERTLLAERRSAAERALLDGLRAKAQVLINEAQLSALR
jgi:parvulin-like peptidyl-prolyl isomerase